MCSRGLFLKRCIVQCKFIIAAHVGLAAFGSGSLSRSIQIKAIYQRRPIHPLRSIWRIVCVRYHPPVHRHHHREVHHRIPTLGMSQAQTVTHLMKKNSFQSVRAAKSLYIDNGLAAIAGPCGRVIALLVGSGSDIADAKTVRGRGSNAIPLRALAVGSDGCAYKVSPWVEVVLKIADRARYVSAYNKSRA